MSPRAIALALLILCGLRSGAQGWDYRLFTLEDGLPQTQVTRIFEDSRGYLWVGTKMGICYYNGDQFVNPFASLGEYLGQVFDIDEDMDGHMLILTNNGLIKFDGRSIVKQWKGVYAPHSRIFPDSNLSIWISHLDGRSISYWKGDSLHVFPEENAILAEHERPTIYYAPDEQELYIACLSGQLYSFDWNNLRMLRDQAGRLAFDKKCGNVLSVGTEPMDIDSPYKWRYYAFPDTTAFLQHMGNDFIVRDSFPSRDVTFYSTGQRMVMCFGEKLWELSLDDLHPTDVTVSSERNIWIGSDQGLLLAYQSPFRKMFANKLKEVWSMVQGPDSNFYFSSYYHGTHVSNGAKANRLPIKWNKRIHGNFYYNIDFDWNGRLLLPRTERTFRYDPTNDITEALDAGALTLEIDHHRKRIFLGGYNHLVLVDRYDSIGEVQPGGPNMSWITDIEILPNGDAWLGSYWSIARYFASKDTIIQYYSNRHTPHGLPHGFAICVYRDWHGDMWFGGGMGLYYQHRDSLGPPVRVVDNSFSTFIKDVTNIDSNQLLVAAIEGPILVDKTSLLSGQPVYRLYNRHSGFDDVEPAQNGLYRDFSGTIWLMAANHIYTIDTSLLDLDFAPLHCRVHQVNGEAVSFHQDPLPYLLPRGDNHLRMDFEAIGIDRPFLTEYAYRLGNDGPWSDWESIPRAEYANLSSGTYIFQVRAKSGGSTQGGVTTYPVTSFQLRVSLPLWKEPSFYKYALITILLLTGVVWLLFRRTSRAQRDIREKEEMIRFLQIQTLQAQMNPHFIFNVLTSLQSLILAGTPEKANRYLVKLSTMIRRFLDSSISGDVSLEDLEDNFISLDKELELLALYIEFEQLQYPNRFTSQISCDPPVVPEATRIQPMLIQPFVENAIKHGLLHKAKAGHLDVHFTRSNGHLQCMVTDDGIGRDRARRMKRQSPQMFKSRGTDLVLKRVEILNRLGHDIRVSYHEDDRPGTSVRISFALQD